MLVFDTMAQLSFRLCLCFRQLFILWQGVVGLPGLMGLPGDKGENGSVGKRGRRVSASWYYNVEMLVHFFASAKLCAAEAVMLSLCPVDPAASRANTLFVSHEYWAYFDEIWRR